MLSWAVRAGQQKARGKARQSQLHFLFTLMRNTACGSHYAYISFSLSLGNSPSRQRPVLSSGFSHYLSSALLPLSFPSAAHRGWFIASWALTLTHTDAHFSLHVLLLAYLCCPKPISTLLLPVPPSATESCSCLTHVCMEWLHTSSLWWAKLSLWCPKSCTRTGITAAALPRHVCFYKAMTCKSDLTLHTMLSVCTVTHT